MSAISVGRLRDRFYADQRIREESFDPAQAAILTNAYTQAVIAVGGVYIIDAAAQIKLAKIILVIATKCIKAGGKVETHMDAESIATLASTRFLHLLADDPVQAYAP